MVSSQNASEPVYSCPICAEIRIHFFREQSFLFGPDACLALPTRAETTSIGCLKPLQIEPLDLTPEIVSPLWRTEYSFVPLK